jgi:hypothetical protein
MKKLRYALPVFEPLQPAGPLIALPMEVVNPNNDEAGITDRAPASRRRNRGIAFGLK